MKIHLAIVVVTLSTLLAVVFGAAAKITSPVRTHEELCTELSFELERGVAIGMLTQAEADRLRQRCRDLDS